MSTVTASASHPPPLHTPYVLFVGTLEPRKNLDRLLQAWRSLPLAVRQGWRLRLIGATGWMVKPPGADPADREEGIEVLGHLHDAALSAQLGKTYDESQAPARKVAEERKNEIHVLTEAETDNWIKASAPIYDSWVADVEKKGLPGKAMVQEARDLVQKYTKK